MNSWFFATEQQVKTLSFEDHLEFLLAKLAPARHELLRLQAIEDVTAFVTCYLWSKDGGGAFTMTRLQTRRLSELGLELQFELSFYGAEE